MNKNRANWQKIVYVKEAPLMLDGVALRHGRTDKILDDRVTIRNQSYLYLDGDIYYEATEVRNYDRWIEKNSGNLQPIFDLVYKIADRFAKVESKFDAGRLKRKDNKELVALLKKYSSDYQNVLGTLYVPVPMDRVLSEKIKRYISKKFPDQITEIFNSLTKLEKKHNVVQYHEELLKLALTKKNSNKKLELLAQKYAFLGIKFYFGRPFTAATCRKHLREMDDPTAERRHKNQIKRNETKAYTAAMKKLNPPGLIRRQIKWLQEAVFMRTYRLERISEGENNSFVLLREIGQRLGIDPFDLIYFRFGEIERALAETHKIGAAEIKLRKQPFGMVSLDAKTKFAFGRNYAVFRKRYKFRVVQMKEIKGQVAFPGLVRGRVRIIKTDKEMHTIRPGEILVTRMTTPDYIFAMRISAAVVTDVGGVTSHASVVSRELAKPCIIGTGHATQILKTGDLVEVDANTGVVKRI
ncbi:MAG: hypothetical protein A3J07_03750 [Candidatus Doudnabacteria bacterium RIFCSPLOWO2_02_FULL_49_13]|uniref:PEP-utilising enzyme mobile domain-containing protein n=1 Tax=Candidatus Doudnabacteria bacterium RIFCSPHIGHO2_12_FULL_48_16 TaxID=1817838 RepID=A0A1F5PK36_9BACT|nr:MAG: hypothetical protein A3B77_02560 [Candidatus Doudnabacteria bacterium RIFCSPHIGHO2_02_FULL_49_24]OGE89589.1 MAG: hypothetical protein A2760_03765 [Candidatus Doudnabacteria bacterium RIFCSPHIGHO2_01_FULL_50_67]OGE90032.1 MAG: hypothetical protein A3E29_02895 [Candidatus Doudnabacteria bacterium RIFCSPHIGHO2_12_FULL_48_16]OGE96605.1 MAG: hypothetical protein A2990_00205 [Candidatus Doudnabacteria bacterium RIFCSPLOWO2_01_FULL_49_40]OGF03175.1 MAG: hypothetical protein A3J07_03750 [Candid